MGSTNKVSDPLKVCSGTRQGDAFSTIVISLTMEASIRNIGSMGMIHYNPSQSVGFVDNTVITSRSQNSIIRHTIALQIETSKYGLTVNLSKANHLASSNQPRPL